ncbi:uncharacterized mitochondrial protein AtMg00310-like [Cannabis sativa]|uniref:uncharacterized mitochondrial protein AtMg00310-like n=1 Tax=Cannabis sativa TaxID=3483 RepID=UPI0029CAA137|nr:uncharacterized mitochondrial protein AtMg00310-like [Cannabis sativa]
MGCFKLPFRFHKNLDSLMANFRWGGNAQTRKTHWVAWHTLCHSKFRGGLDFRYMKAFNQAMLAKQAWRIIQFPQTLVASLLKARYFPHTTFPDAGKGCRPSLVWNNISWGKELLLSGLKKKVGNGADISIHDDTWVPIQPLTP